MTAIIMIYVTILIIEFIPLLKGRRWKEMAVFGMFYTSSLAAAILIHYRIEVPSVMAYLGELVKKLGLDYKSMF